MVITSHKFEGIKPADSSSKGGKRNHNNRDEPKVGLTNLVLIVNNWQFVRDVQKEAKCRGCTVSDFQVQLKLSSTAFRNAANPDCAFPFDKHAANFPFESFVSVMTSPIVNKYVKDVKEMYIETEGPFDDDDDDDDNDNESVDINVMIVRNAKRRHGNKAVLEDEDDVPEGGGGGGGEEEDEDNMPLTQVRVTNKKNKK